MPTTHSTGLMLVALALHISHVGSFSFCVQVNCGPLHEIHSPRKFGTQAKSSLSRLSGDEWTRSSKIVLASRRCLPSDQVQERSSRIKRIRVERNWRYVYNKALHANVSLRENPQDFESEYSLDVMETQQQTKSIHGPVITAENFEPSQQVQDLVFEEHSESEKMVEDIKNDVRGEAVAIHPSQKKRKDQLAANVRRLEKHLQHTEAQLRAGDALTANEVYSMRTIMRDIALSLSLLGRISGIVSWLSFRVFIITMRAVAFLFVKILAYAEAREWWVPEAVEIWERWSGEGWNSSQILGVESRLKVIELYKSTRDSLLQFIQVAGKERPRWLADFIADAKAWLRNRWLAIMDSSTFVSNEDSIQGDESTMNAGNDNLAKPLWGKTIPLRNLGTVQDSGGKSFAERMDEARARSTRRLEARMLGLPIEDSLSTQDQSGPMPANSSAVQFSTPRRIGASRPIISPNAMVSVDSGNLIRNVSDFVTRRLVGRGNTTKRVFSTVMAAANQAGMAGQVLLTLRNNTVAFGVDVVNNSVHALADVGGIFDLDKLGATIGAVGAWPGFTGLIQGGEGLKQGMIGFWGGAMKQLDSWDSNLVSAVENIEDTLRDSMTKALADLPLMRQAEDIVMGYTKGLGDYIKVQRWWHRMLLWGTPKWEAMEKVAKDRKLPEFCQRLFLNAIFYRERYFRWFLVIGMWELVVLRRTATLITLSAGLLSAVIVRSDLAASADGFGEKSSGTGTKVAKAANILTNDLFKTLSRIGTAKEEPAKGRIGSSTSLARPRRRSSMKDHSRFAAALAVLSAGWAVCFCPFTRRWGVVTLVGHAFLHARQHRKPPAPKKVFGGTNGVALRMRMDLLDLFRPKPSFGTLLPPGPPVLPSERL